MASRHRTGRVRDDPHRTASREGATRLILALAAGTVATCWMVITFSFALQYARRDIEQGGLSFPGAQDPVFSDYI